MTELRNRMIADMKLHGLAPGLQKDSPLLIIPTINRILDHVWCLLLGKKQSKKAYRLAETPPPFWAIQPSQDICP